MSTSSPTDSRYPVRFNATSKVSGKPIEMWFADEESANAFAASMVEFYTNVFITRIPSRAEFLAPMAMCTGGYLAALSDGINALRRSKRTHAATKLGELLTLLSSD